MPKTQKALSGRVQEEDGCAGAARALAELGKQFEPSGQAIRNWVAQADRDEGDRQDGLTTNEREELREKGQGITRNRVARLMRSAGAPGEGGDKWRLNFFLDTHAGVYPYSNSSGT